MSVKKKRPAGATVRKEAIKRSVAGIGKRLSSGADRVADIIIEEDQGDGQKGKKIVAETASMFKDMKTQFQSNTRDVQPKDLVKDAAFCVGRASGVVGRAVQSLIKDLG